MRRLLHISDLHFGRTDPIVTEAVLREAQALKPDLIVISGDLTQRARPQQFAEAADFLNRLPTRYLVVPGNHDIPLYHLLLRFFQPLRGYRRYIESQSQSVFEDREMIVAGMNTATRWRWVEGRLKEGELQRVSGLLRNAPHGTLKILVMHHPPEGDLHDIDRLLSAQPDLVLSGHLHKKAATLHASGTLFVAAGTATSTRLRDENNTFNVIDLRPATPEARGSIRVGVHTWNGAAFECSWSEEFAAREPGRNSGSMA